VAAGHFFLTAAHYYSALRRGLYRKAVAYRSPGLAASRPTLGDAPWDFITLKALHNAPLVEVV
jgi:hypothetical protein